MHLLIHIDGGARGNPGPAGVGIVVQDADSGAPLHEAGYYLGKATNNEAEYQGLIRSLDIVSKLSPERITIHSDSELMVKQILGSYRVKSPNLKPLFEEAQAALLGIDNWQIRHVYREENKRADELVNKAIDAKRDVVEEAIDNFQPGDGPALKYRGETPGVGARLSDPGPNTGPAWTATIVQAPGTQCPARCRANTSYAFGPETPEGMCIYAAQAVFDEEPAHWVGRDQHQYDAACGKCSVTIRITLDD